MTAERAPAMVRVTRELGCSHREFFRALPPVLERWEWRSDGRVVNAWRGNARVTITLGPEGTRAIALLRLPVTRAEFAFEGLDEAEIDEFMTRFWRAFQRGGG